MSLPAFTKTWSFSLNNATGAFVSLLDTASQLMYGVKNFLVATMGATVWGSCDGTTGDNTDRWASKTNAQTRGATTAAANSWVVFTWAGGQLCISYVGATDDIFRVSYSPSSSFVLAGTPTNTPTTTDEVIVATAISMVNVTASAQRVWSVIAASDRSVFRAVTFRSAVIVNCWGIEKLAASLNAPNITSSIAFAFLSNATVGTSFTGGGVAFGQFNAAPGGSNSMSAWIGGASKSIVGGGMMFNGATTWSTVFNTATPELNGAAPMYPILVGGSGTAAQGWLGTRFDAYHAYGNSIALGDYHDDVTANTRLLWAGGGMMWPWTRGTALVTA